mgnify:CR=1 FL=1
MLRYSCLLWLCVVGLRVFSPIANAKPSELAQKPNVLFLAVDDMNDWIGCLDSKTKALTPNFDRLAARGVCFSNAHTAGVFCAPSRAAIFTGQFFAVLMKAVKANHIDTFANSKFQKRESGY